MVEQSERSGPTGDARARLRWAGLRVTSARLAVLEAVAGVNRHVDADGVAAAVRRRLGSLSTQAAYDDLRAPVAAGLVRRIALAGGPARYEVRLGGDHHVVCRRCGAVADVDGAAGDTPCLTAVDGSGYEIDEAEVNFWGRCPACVASRSVSSGGRKQSRSGRRQLSDGA